MLAAVSAEAAAVRDSVVAPRPFTFTLTGRSSPLRLNLRNDADEPLQVVVRPSSPKLTFPDGDQLVELDAGRRHRGRDPRRGPLQRHVVARGRHR